MQFRPSALAALALPATLLAALLSAPAVEAQIVTNPRLVEFDPSADHAAVSPTDSQPLVNTYVLQFYLAGAQSPFQTLDMGKPAPQSDGKIRFDFSASGTAWPQLGALYEARVAAVGPGGSGVSEASNQFTVQAPCSFTVTPTTLAPAAAGGSHTVTVATGATCAWTASSGAAWITVVPASGTGNGTVTVTIASNAATSIRTATSSVAGSTVAVTQAAAACTYSLSAASASLPASAANGSVSLTTTAGCAWTASSSAPWLTIVGSADGDDTSGTASGTGSATISYAATANATASARIATITVAGQTHSVSQAAATFAPARPSNVRVTETTEE